MQVNWKAQVNTCDYNNTLECMLFFQSGLVENISDVIKEYKEERDLIVRCIFNGAFFKILLSYSQLKFAYWVPLKLENQRLWQNSANIINYITSMQLMLSDSTLRNWYTCSCTSKFQNAIKTTLGTAGISGG